MLPVFCYYFQISILTVKNKTAITYCDHMSIMWEHSLYDTFNKRKLFENQ